MTGLQSNVGLISGINYVELVDQLIAVDGATKDALVKRTQTLEYEKAALTTLMSYFSLSSYMMTSLNSITPFKNVSLNSSNEAILKASKSSSGTAVAGTYTFTPMQVASAQQTVAKGVASDTEALGKTGTITLGKSWSVENEVQLSDINGGNGFTKGSIRITDGSGTRTTIDLKKAVTINDVVDAINNNDNVDVVAELDGDHLVIKDVSGGDLSKFAIQEVSGGSTASSLGLLGHTQQNGTITGNSIYYLGENMSLNLLNDGNGVVFEQYLDDITINCKDGSKVIVDFNRLTTQEEQDAGSGTNKKELTIGDLLNTINNATDGNGVAGKVKAKISADGKGIELQDTTTGAGLTTIDQIGALNPVLQSLGLVSQNYDGNPIDVFSGLTDSTESAKMFVADKAGHYTTVELTEADIKEIQTRARNDTAGSGFAFGLFAGKVNSQLAAAGVEVSIALNSAKDGFDITDSTGELGSVTIQNTVGCDLAERMGLTSTIATDPLTDAMSSTTPGTITVTDRAGNSTDIVIDQTELSAVESLQDMQTLLNSKLTAASPTVGISIEVNSHGTGLNVVDSSGGTNPLSLSSSDSNIATVFGIDNTGGATEDVIAGTEFSATVSRGKIQNGTIQSRNLIGGLDTVLVSTLNGGQGMADAKAEGTVVVQDREGNGATLIFTGDELRSMQTLNDSVKLFNKKLSDAGVKITVKMNDTKTGLQVVDTSGKTEHHLVFMDGTENQVIPEKLAIDAVSAGANITAKSGSSGGLAGKCSLEFENTSAMNGITFAFTTDSTKEGYDNATRTFTFYLDKAALDAENDFAVKNQMVKEAIDDQIAARWSSINNSVPAPEVKLMNSFATNALADAASGAKTAIIAANGGTMGAAEGTALLTFEGTSALNGVAFAFTTDGTKAGYDSANKKMTVYLSSEITAETDAAAQDQMVKEAIDAAIAGRWTAIKSDTGASETDAVEVKQTAGLGAQALTDAAVGAETVVGARYAGGQDGQTHEEEKTVPVASNIASSLGLNVDTANSTASGSSLHRQVISHSTALADLNSGSGVTITGGKFTISDSSGHTATFTIDAKQHTTVGDIISLINTGDSQLKVTAKINDAGDGIVLEEYAGGTQSFSVADADSVSKFASTLGIAGSVSQSEKDADGRMRITASETHSIEVEETDSLDTIRQKINALNKGYSASIVVDGSSTPYRLSISSKTTGAAAGFNIDLSAIGLTTETMSEAKDAMIAYGDASQSSSLVLKSKNNTFKGVVAGMDLTVSGVSDTPVTITAATDGSNVRVALETFVKNYNTFREYLNKQINYTVNSDGQILVSSEEGMGKLWNSSEAKAFDRDITALLLQRVGGDSGITSLASLGITMRQNKADIDEGIGANSSTNTLSFDADKFQAAWDADPEAVQKFFFNETEYTDSNGETVKENSGFAEMFQKVSNSLVGKGDILGKTQARLTTLTDTIERNTERVNFLQERLDWKRQRYLNQFYAMEQAMAKMSSSMDTVSSLASTWASNYSSTGA